MRTREHERGISHDVVQHVRAQPDRVASGGGRDTFLKQLPDGRVVKVVTQGHLGITTYDQRASPVVVILMPVPAPGGQTVSLLMTAEYPAPAHGYPGLDLLGGLGQFTMPLERGWGVGAIGEAQLIEGIRHAAQVCCLRESGILLSVDTFRCVERIDDYIDGETGTPLRQGKSLASVIADVPPASQLRPCVLTRELVGAYAFHSTHRKSNNNWRSLTTERLGATVWVLEPVEAGANLRDSCIDYVRTINDDATHARRALPSMARRVDHRVWGDLPRPAGGFAAAALVEISQPLLQSIDPAVGNDQLFLAATGGTADGALIRDRVADSPCGFNPEGLRAISCRFLSTDFSPTPAPEPEPQPEPEPEPEPSAAL